MAKNIMANSALNAAAGMTMLFTGFFSSIIAARLLGAEANGIIAFSFWLSTSGTLIAGLGTDTILPRMLPQLKAQGFDAGRRRGFAAYLGQAVLVAVLLFVALYGFGFWESERLNWISAQPSVIVITGVLFCVQALGMLAINYLIAEQELATFFKLTVLSSVAQLGTVLAGAWFFGVEGALAGYVLGQAAFCLYTVSVIFTAKRDACGQLPRNLARASLIISIQIFIEAIFLNRIELLFLQKYLNVESVGFYAIGLSLANMALQLPVQATGSLVPYYTEQLHTRTDGRLPVNLFEGVMRSLAYITMPMSFGLAAISWELVAAIYGADFRPAGNIVALLALSAPVSVFISVATKYMFAIGRERQRTVIGAIGAVVMVGFCLAMVPLYGGEGAAMVRILTYTVMCVMMVRRMDFDGSMVPMFWSIIKVTVAALGCGAAAFVVSDNLGGVLGLAAAIVAGMLAYGVGLKLLRAVPQADITLIAPLIDRLPPRFGRHAGRILRLIAT